MKVLVVNAGSSSLKYQVMDMDTEKVITKGLCERIGIDGRHTNKTNGKKLEENVEMKDHTQALKVVMDCLLSDAVAEIESLKDIDAVGHRVLHGGEKYSDSVLIDEETHKSIVIVPDDQFSLAIGKGGQNVRLASQVTGWRIDIKDETTAYREEIRFKPNVYTA